MANHLDGRLLTELDTVAPRFPNRLKSVRI